MSLDENCLYLKLVQDIQCQQVVVAPAYMDITCLLQDIPKKWAVANDFKLIDFGMVSIRGEEMQLCDAANLFRINYSNASATQKGPKHFHPKELVSVAFQMMVDELIKVKKQDVINTITFKGENDLISKWLKACLRREASVVEIEVLRHWLWLVKRKLVNKLVKDQIFPVFYGAQGIGKTQAVMQLITVLEMFTWNASLTDLTDSRFGYQLEKRYIIFLDELEKADKTDSGALKNVITATYKDIRRLSTNMVDKVKVNVSPIGCTNRSVSEVLSDATGMRRFFEYEIEGGSSMDWDTINTMDYLELWSGVDESNDNGYLAAIKTKLAMVQAGYTTQTPIFEWWGTMPPGGKFDVFVSTEDVLHHLNTWALQNGYKYTYNSKNLKAHFKSIGVSPWQEVKRGYILTQQIAATIISSSRS